MYYKLPEAKQDEEGNEPLKELEKKLDKHMEYQREEFDINEKIVGKMAKTI